jgi:hypothetical protein
VLLTLGFKLHFAEAQGSPLFFQRAPPIHQLHADCAFVGSPGTVG